MEKGELTWKVWGRLINDFLEKSYQLWMIKEGKIMNEQGILSDICHIKKHLDKLIKIKGFLIIDISGKRSPAECFINLSDDTDILIDDENFIDCLLDRGSRLTGGIYTIAEKNVEIKAKVVSSIKFNYSYIIREISSVYIPKNELLLEPPFNKLPPKPSLDINKIDFKELGIKLEEQ